MSPCSRIWERSPSAVISAHSLLPAVRTAPIILLMRGKAGARDLLSLLSLQNLQPPTPRNGFVVNFRHKGGRWPAQGFAHSKAAAAWKINFSPNQGPTICSPTGRFSLVKPHGIEIAGLPAMLKG